MSASSPDRAELVTDASLLTRLDRAPVTRTLRVGIGVVILVWLVESFDIGLVSTVILVLGPQWDLTSTQVGLLGASATIGLVLGMLPAGRMVDVFGRKKVLIAGTALFCRLHRAQRVLAELRHARHPAGDRRTRRGRDLPGAVPDDLRAGEQARARPDHGLRAVGAQLRLHAAGTGRAVVGQHVQPGLVVARALPDRGAAAAARTGADQVGAGEPTVPAPPRGQGGFRRRPPRGPRAGREDRGRGRAAARRVPGRSGDPGRAGGQRDLGARTHPAAAAGALPASQRDRLLRADGVVRGLVHVAHLRPHDLRDARRHRVQLAGLHRA